MKAGRELDALVAEKVMGLNVVAGVSCVWEAGITHDDYGIGGTGTCVGEEPFYHGVPYYSTDIAAAWEVVEKLRAESTDDRHIHWTLTQCEASVFAEEPLGARWQVDILRTYDRPHISDGYRGAAPTAPHAICLAALKAVAP